MANKELRTLTFGNSSMDIPENIVKIAEEVFVNALNVNVTNSVFKDLVTYTATKDGLAMLTAYITWNANPNGIRYLRLTKNGESQGYVTQSASSSGYTSHALTLVQRIAQGDVLTLSGFQSSGGTIAAQTASISGLLIPISAN